MSSVSSLSLDVNNSFEIIVEPTDMPRAVQIDGGIEGKEM
jgi:hypothetical protein